MIATIKDLKEHDDELSQFHMSPRQYVGCIKRFAVTFGDPALVKHMLRFWQCRTRDWQRPGKFIEKDGENE